MASDWTVATRILFSRTKNLTLATDLSVPETDKESLASGRAADDLDVTDQGLHGPLPLLHALKGQALQALLLLRNRTGTFNSQIAQISSW